MNDGFPSNMPLAAGAILARIAGGTAFDINGGTIDGTVIGGTTPAAISCTTLTTSVGFQYGTIAVGANWGEQFIITTTGATEAKLVLAGSGGYRWSMRQADPAGVGSLAFRYEESGIDVLTLMRSGAATFAAGVSCTTLTATGAFTSNLESNSPLVGRFIGGYLGYTGIRQDATNHDFHIEVYNGGSFLTPLSISQGGIITLRGVSPGTPGGGHVLIGGGVTAAATGFNVGANQVIGAQGAAVADASGGATVDAEARTAINTLLARLRTHGLIAT